MSNYRHFCVNLSLVLYIFSCCNGDDANHNTEGNLPSSTSSSSNSESNHPNLHSCSSDNNEDDNNTEGNFPSSSNSEAEPNLEATHSSNSDHIKSGETIENSSFF